MILIYACFSIALAAISMPLFKAETTQHIMKYPIENTIDPPRLLTTSATISNYENAQYYTYASIGNPPQQFTFLIDTGSSWTWICWKLCSSCHYGNKFAPESSSSYRNSSQSDKETYGKGSIYGWISTDNFNFGGDFDTLTASNQNFLVVQSEADFSNLNANGLMGFGFDALSDGVNTVMSTLKSEGKISYKQFSVYLSDDRSYSDLYGLEDSMLMIDGYDLGKYSSESDFTYIPLASNDGFWRVQCNGVVVNGTVLLGGSTAIIDTGTSIFYGPKDDVMTFLGILLNNYSCYISSSGYFLCPCGVGKKFPVLVFLLGGKPFTLRPVDYMVKSNDVCSPNIGYGNMNYWLLGDSFIRRFYINFDMEKYRIGFAKAISSDLASFLESIAIWKLALIILCVQTI